jgi:hypothetical protein
MMAHDDDNTDNSDITDNNSGNENDNDKAAGNSGMSENGVHNRNSDIPDEHADESGNDESHFSDEELEAALAGFEQEFLNGDLAGQANDGSKTSPDRGESGSGDEGPQETHESDDPDPSSIGPRAIDPDTAAEDARTIAHIDFDEELQGLIGNKAQTAAIVTRLASAQLLAAFCQLSDISADCLASDQGAVAVLRNLDGDAPEAAVKDLTTVVSGMPAILAVNRADRLESTLYLQGEAGQSFAPPILFASTPEFVEDLMLGIDAVRDLKAQGFHVVDSSSLSHEDAMKVIAEHTKFGRGSSRIQ